MTKRLANDFQFIDVGRGDPDKKTLQSRKTEYVEIYNPFTQDQVAEQSHRCLECGNPYCEWKCPVHNFHSQLVEAGSRGQPVRGGRAEPPDQYPAGGVRPGLPPGSPV